MLSSTRWGTRLLLQTRLLSHKEFPCRPLVKNSLVVVLLSRIPLSSSCQNPLAAVAHYSVNPQRQMPLTVVVGRDLLLLYKKYYSTQCPDLLLVKDSFIRSPLLPSALDSPLSCTCASASRLYRQDLAKLLFMELALLTQPLFSPIIRNRQPLSTPAFLRKDVRVC